jgi:hypothetical protein
VKNNNSQGETKRTANFKSLSFRCGGMVGRDRKKGGFHFSFLPSSIFLSPPRSPEYRGRNTAGILYLPVRPIKEVEAKPGGRHLHKATHSARHFSYSTGAVVGQNLGHSGSAPSGHDVKRTKEAPLDPAASP